MRIQVEVLASGQPRPYADSRAHVRVTVDVFFAWLGDPKDERSGWRPMTVFDFEKPKDPTQVMFLPANPNTHEEFLAKRKTDLIALLRALKCGYPDTDTPRDWADTKLQWLRQISSGVYEFYTTNAYTD